MKTKEYPLEIFIEKILVVIIVIQRYMLPISTRRLTHLTGILRASTVKSRVLFYRGMSSSDEAEKAAAMAAAGPKVRLVLLRNIY